MSDKKPTKQVSFCPSSLFESKIKATLNKTTHRHPKELLEKYTIPCILYLQQEELPISSALPPEKYFLKKNKKTRKKEARMYVSHEVYSKLTEIKNNYKISMAKAIAIVMYYACTTNHPNDSSVTPEVVGKITSTHVVDHNHQQDFLTSVLFNNGITTGSCMSYRFGGRILVSDINFTKEGVIDG